MYKIKCDLNDRNIIQMFKNIEYKVNKNDNVYSMIFHGLLRHGSVEGELYTFEGSAMVLLIGNNQQAVKLRMLVAFSIGSLLAQCPKIFECIIENALKVKGKIEKAQDHRGNSLLRLIAENGDDYAAHLEVLLERGKLNPFFKNMDKKTPKDVSMDCHMHSPRLVRILEQYENNYFSENLYPLKEELIHNISEIASSKGPIAQRKLYSIVEKVLKEKMLEQLSSAPSVIPFTYRDDIGNYHLSQAGKKIFNQVRDELLTLKLEYIDKISTSMKDVEHEEVVNKDEKAIDKIEQVSTNMEDIKHEEAINQIEHGVIGV